MQLTLVEQIDLTPNDADAHTFLLKLQSDSPLDYQAGDWLTVKGQNPPELVATIAEKLTLNLADHIELRRCGLVTIEQALTHELELTLLDPAILNKLVRQYDYQAWSSRAEMQAYAEGRDLLDLLDAFPELCHIGADFLSLLSPLAPRYYSIASAPQVYPNQIHLLYKAIRFEREGRVRQGVTSSWMQQAAVGAQLQCEIKPNAHFSLPQDPATPIIMCAAGTGLAPFIGFMQARSQLVESGENLLLFGETHSATRFLCQAQLETWQAQNQLTLLTAFSRDQTPKVYIQDLLQQQQAWLRLWEAGAILYICGDKTGMAKGVEESIKNVWINAYGWDQTQAQQAWLTAKKAQRIQLDVY